MFRLIYRIADKWRDRGRRFRDWDPDLALGRRGEDLAHRFLQRAGMTIVARNYETPSGTGELDLVAWDGDTLVFVEVKTRSGIEFGVPERAVDDEKRKRILRGAADYRRRVGAEVHKVRFDIVAIVVERRGKGGRGGVEINHVRSAFLPYEATRARAVGAGGRE